MEGNWLIQQRKNMPGWLINLLPLISAVLGIGILWATWILYRDAWETPGFPWYRWIPAVFMVIAGLISFGAAVLFAIRKPAAWDLLWTAICIIPVVMFIRLFIVALTALVMAGRWVGENPDRLFDGTLVDRLLNPVQIVILLLVALSLIIRWRQARKQQDLSGGDGDER